MKLTELIKTLNELQSTIGDVDVLVSSDGEGNYISELMFVQPEKGVYDPEEMDYTILHPDDLPDYEEEGYEINNYVVIWP